MFNDKWPWNLDALSPCNIFIPTHLVSSLSCINYKTMKTESISLVSRQQQQEKAPINLTLGRAFCKPDSLKQLDFS